MFKHIYEFLHKWLKKKQDEYAKGTLAVNCTLTGHGEIVIKPFTRADGTTRMAKVCLKCDSVVDYI